MTLSAATLGFTPVVNEKIFLFTPNKAAVLDGVKVKATHQARRVASPPGEFLETTNPAEQTPGAVNNIALPTAIVINEIMYHHRPQYRDGATAYAESGEQWVELFNRSGAAVDVSGWKLDDAIGFTFPAATSIPASGYVVIAGNVAAFNAAHPGVTALGPFSGGLSRDRKSVV